MSQLRKTIEQAQANRHIGTTSFNKASSRSHAIIQFKVLATVDVAEKSKTPSPPPVTGSSSSSLRRNAPRASSTLSHATANGYGKLNNNNNHNGKNGTNRPLRIMFIDLAGSERGIDAQNNEHDNRKEGAEINQSLLAVIIFF